jgi:DNA-binding winged helix-turn-helix (wHTH) protein
MISGQGRIQCPRGTDTEGRVEKSAAKNHAHPSPSRESRHSHLLAFIRPSACSRDRRVKMGGRAFDILLTWAERSPEVVTNRDLIAQVWGNYPIEDGAPRFSIAALRTTLGEDESSTARYIGNVHGRGYRVPAPPVVWTHSATSRPSAFVALSLLPRKPLAMNRILRLLSCAAGFLPAALLVSPPHCDRNPRTRLFFMDQFDRCRALLPA